MRKLLVAVAAATIFLAASSYWQTEATPLTGAADSLAAIKSYSAVQKAGCMFGTSRCPAHTKWVCVKTPITKKCACTHC